jgi:hypothetical protein
LIDDFNGIHKEVNLYKIISYLKLDAYWGRHLDKKIKKEFDRILDQAKPKKRPSNLHIYLVFGLVCLLLTGLIITQNPAPPELPLTSADPENPVQPTNFENGATPEQDAQAISSGLKFAVGCSHWKSKPSRPFLLTESNN